MYGPPLPDASIWYLDYSTVVICAIGILLLVSLTTRYWGSSLKRLVRDSQTRPVLLGERTPVDWIADHFVRLIGNPALIAGGLIVSILLIASVWPSSLSPYDPEAVGRTLQNIDGKVMGRPFPPSPPYPMGTDVEGRDLLTRIIHGTARTLGLCAGVALLRLFISVSLGVTSGWRGGALGQQIISMVSVSASIPSLLFAFIFILTIGPRLGYGVFLLGLGLTGWAELTNIIQGSVKWIRSQPYIDTAIALGSTPTHITRWHIIPNLSPQLIPAVALELSAILLTLGELGFLGLFLGESFFQYLPQVVRSPILPEWAGMLAGTRISIFNWPWLPIAPAVAFMIAILGFNLLASGLRTWLDPFREIGNMR